MIYRMMRDIEANLQARKYPIKFEYAPAPPRDLYAHRGFVVVERDTSRGETFGPALGAQQNPRRCATRSIGVQWTIYAQCGLDGAMRNDHEHECDLYVDAIQVELCTWAKAAGVISIEITEARYLSATERDGADLNGDVAYLLRFTIPRGVVQRDYDGGIQPKATVATSSVTTEASIDGTIYKEVP